MVGSAGQHLLDFDRDLVAIDHNHPTCNRQVVGQDLDLVLFRGVELDDRAATQSHDLMDGHGGRSEDDHQIDRDFIEGRHWAPGLTLLSMIENNTVMVS